MPLLFVIHLLDARYDYKLLFVATLLFVVTSLATAMVKGELGDENIGEPCFQCIPGVAARKCVLGFSQGCGAVHIGVDGAGTEEEKLCVQIEASGDKLSLNLAPKL